MNMQTTSTTIGISRNMATQRIHLRLSSELNETLNTRPAHSLILAICALILIGIVSIVGYSAIGTYDISPSTYRASLRVTAGTVYVIRATTGEPLRVEAGDTLLLDAHDQVLSHGGKATVTFFDGSTRELSHSTYTFDSSSENSSNSINAVEPTNLHRRQRMWSPPNPGAMRTNNAASVLG